MMTEILIVKLNIRKEAERKNNVEKKSAKHQE